MNYRLNVPRIGRVRNIEEVASALQDIQTFLNSLYEAAVYTKDASPSTGAIKFVVREADGSYHLWSLVTGSGATITLNAGTRVATITAP